jgi:hypothetical protein
VEVEVTKFQMYLKDIGKKLPSNKLVYDHTFLFLQRILGYHNAPIYFNPPANRFASLLFMWQPYILNELELFDEESFEKINKDNGDIKQPSLKELRIYIENMTSKIQ